MYFLSVASIAPSTAYVRGRLRDGAQPRTGTPARELRDGGLIRFRLHLRYKIYLPWVHFGVPSYALGAVHCRQLAACSHTSKIRQAAPILSTSKPGRPCAHSTRKVRLAIGWPPKPRRQAHRWRLFTRHLSWNCRPFSLRSRPICPLQSVPKRWCLRTLTAWSTVPPRWSGQCADAHERAWRLRAIRGWLAEAAGRDPGTAGISEWGG